MLVASLMQILTMMFGAVLATVAGSELNRRLGLTGWSELFLPVFMVGICFMAMSPSWPLLQRLRRLEADLRRLEARLAEKQPPSTAP